MNDTLTNRLCHVYSWHGNANHEIKTPWGTMFLCQECAEYHAASMAEGMDPQDPPVSFELVIDSHGRQARRDIPSLSLAIFDFNAAVQLMGTCGIPHTHTVKLLAVQDSLCITLMQETV